MRVTATGSTAQSIAAVQNAASRLASLQNQLSSGKRITTSSDDPDGTVVALGLRSSLARSGQYAETSGDALAWLSTADSAYSQSVSVLQSARTLVVQALNTGANDATANEAIAAQLDGLRQTLLSVANTTYNGRPVFGGATASAVAYDASGTYVGDAGSVTRQVAARASVDVGATGTDVFGSGTDDVFATLTDLAAALRTSPSTLAPSALSRLDSAIQRVGVAQASAGSAYQQVQRLATSRTTSDAAVTARLADIEQIDFADIAVKTASAQTAYQAALQTTAQVSRVSLLDFLR